MTLSELLATLNRQPVDFKTVMAVIDAEYDFTPTRFINGSQVNEANTNNGSCKIFAFGLLHGLSEQATLHAFGDFYTRDVLQHPQGTDHQNIRNFMQTGWSGVQFDGEALHPHGH
ncbi:HopJ type III effector protein [Marinospirillum alkaliphilum]|uniref:HopJ type III effector protein n=1 Tax=Marinospirillum alkaliphilum DSM 21637 TaxID=1122209 RepID=A0A1K1ZNX9_9GAMM|nr:HopJ type III effector protein [Marinospirillum alkaliphilum]SFX75807.1 HopJ type III effector protein [Marinospirillum alkaliphilum DSM 21637]